MIVMLTTGDGVKNIAAFRSVGVELVQTVSSR